MANPNDFILGDYVEGAEQFNPGEDLDAQAKAANMAMALEYEKTSLDTANQVTACFTTAQGRVFLEWLRGMTVEQPAFFPHDHPLGSEGRYATLSAAEQGMFREGQNSVYRQIVNMLELVERGPSEGLVNHLASQQQPQTEGNTDGT